MEKYTNPGLENRVRGNDSAPAEYVGSEGVVIEDRDLTQECLIHFDRNAKGSAWLLDSSVDAVPPAGLSLAGSGLCLAALALGGFLVAPKELHTHTEMSGDMGELNLLDLNAPGVTGSQVGMSYVQVAVNLRDPGVIPAADTAHQDAKVQAAKTLSTSEKFADRDAWLRSWFDYFRATEHPRNELGGHPKKAHKIC